MQATDEERKLAEHLQKAGELLKAGELDNAEREIGLALSVNRNDVRARNLRGLWLFRGARYDEAEKIYVELCEKWPDDAALRLNLGLVQLRMGKFTDATGHLRRVVAVEAENQRAQGYLGLALLRTGALKEAHEAFVKAGQTELARQVEVQLHKQESGGEARVELREAAGFGERTIEKQDQPFAAVELDAPIEEVGRHGEWQLREAGQGVPLPGAASGDGAPVPHRLQPAEAVPAFATRRLLRDPTAAEPILLGDGGMLVMRVDGRLPTRTLGTVASTGTIAFEPLHRRVRAQSSAETFGDGAEAMFVAVGHGRIIVAARGARFSVLAARRRRLVRARAGAVRLRGVAGVGVGAVSRRRRRGCASGAVPRQWARGVAHGAPGLHAEDGRGAAVRRSRDAARRAWPRGAEAGPRRRRAGALHRVQRRGRASFGRAAHHLFEARESAWRCEDERSAAPPTCGASGPICPISSRWGGFSPFRRSSRSSTTTRRCGPSWLPPSTWSRRSPTRSTAGWRAAASR